MIDSIRILLPEITLSASALLLLGLDAFVPRGQRVWAFLVSTLALFAALAMVLLFPAEGLSFGMMASDPLSRFFKALAILSCFSIFLLSEKDAELMGSQAGTYASLLILSTVGVMFLASAQDLLILFIGLELTTVPLFVLAGFLRKDLKSSEGAIKFFLVGAFSTGLMIYGMSFLYGITGSTKFWVIRDAFKALATPGDQALFLMGVLFMLAGLAFKFSLVPFHQWTPDAYEGAPTPVTAFFSASRDAGVIAVLLRFFGEFVSLDAVGLTQIFAVLSVLTMTIGNLSALKQDNLKRLLAYSSIAHAGTIIIGLIAGNQLGREGAMLYSFAYFLMNLGAFAVVIILERLRGSCDIGAVKGLAKENLGLALLMTFFLLSLSGIPPFLGFWGKFYVFAAAVESRMYWLVAAGLMNSVIGVYYYFRIAHNMFFAEPEGQPLPSPVRQWGAQAATLAAAAGIILLGLAPQHILDWVKSTAHLLP